MNNRERRLGKTQLRLDKEHSKDDSGTFYSLNNQLSAYYVAGSRAQGLALETLDSGVLKSWLSQLLAVGT